MFKQGFIKRAQEYGLSIKQADDFFKSLPPQFQAQQQQYMGQHPRREQLGPQEQEAVSRGKSQIIPKIFTSMKDSPTVDMYNPMTKGVLAGGAGAATGGLLGGMAGGEEHGQLLSILGALLGGGIGGAAGYHSRKAKNEDIEENMRHLPENATRRQYEADPLLQKNKDREHEKQIARLGY